MDEQDPTSEGLFSLGLIRVSGVLIAPGGHSFEDGDEIPSFLRKPVRRRAGAVLDDTVCLEIFEALAERARIEAGDRSFEISKSALARRQVAQNQGSPFAAYDFHRSRDAAGASFE